MKIAILGDALDLQNAGIHQYTKQLVEALVRYDQDNEYLLIRYSDQNPVAGMAQLVVGSALGFARDPFRLFFKTPKLLRQHKIEAVFEPAHFGPFNLPKEIKRITMVHDLTPQLFPELHPTSRQLVHRLAMPGILRKADLILTNSEYTQSDLHEHHPFTKGKVDAILLGRDAQFKPTSNPEVLKDYGLNKPYFLFVGTIEPRKNLVMLLEAFRFFKEQQRSDMQLVLIGGLGWKSQAFEKALATHPFKNDIVRPGFVPGEHLPVFYSAATAFLYPSLYEGFGIPLVEAMACDCPILISNRSSLPEVGGNGAMVLPVSDPKAWALGMAEMLSAPEKRSEMIAQAQKELHRFDWKHYVGKWKLALKKLG